MGSHIFLVSRENFDICIERSIYGGIAHAYQRTNSEIIAGSEAIKPDDLAFFYVKNEGVFGLWRITGWPFYDTTRVWGRSDQSYPYRVCLEPIIRDFANPVVLSDILDLRDKGRIWTFDLGTRETKGHYPITNDESKELIRLLLRNNPIFRRVKPVSNPCSSSDRPLPWSLEVNRNGHLRMEGFLNAFFMRAFARDELKEVIGDYRDFVNHVPTSFNKVMDIFLTHVTSLDSVDILHKYTCMELKTGICGESDLNQVIRYENWLVRKLADGDADMVQSILVGFDFQDRVLQYVQKRKQIDDKTVRLLRYRVEQDKQNILFTEVEFD